MKNETAALRSRSRRCSKWFRSAKRSSLNRNSLFQLVTIISLVIGLPYYARAQEQSLPSPTTTGVLGKKDASALAEINAHLQAVGAGGWQGLEATGTLTFPDGTSHAASLFLAGSKSQRLDIEMESGSRSLRLGGFAGRFRDERGNQGSLPSATSSAGIVAFPRIWADASTSSNVSLYDQHLYSGTGSNHHRITIEYALEGPAGSRLGKETGATDLYFDPSTHLLAYSVDAVTFNESARQVFSRVTSYEQYQQFNGVKVPTTIKQYLNGQLQWTLLLSQITENATHSADTFSF